MENVPLILSETVMLIDVAYLNFVINDMRKHFEQLPGYSLKPMDLSVFIQYLAKDAGLKEGDNEIQVLLVHDEHSERLEYSYPSGVKDELDGKAFRGSLGEFCFASASTEGLVTRQHLYLDLLQVIMCQPEVKRLVLVSSGEEYGDEVEDVLKKFKAKEDGNERKDKEKEVVCFCMEKPAVPSVSCWKMLGYPLLVALGLPLNGVSANEKQ